MSRLALALVVLAALVALPPPPADAPAAFFAPPDEDLDVPAGAVSRGAEPSILVAASGRIFIGDTAGVHRSTDAGGNWTRMSHPFLPGVFTDGRALAIDGMGRLYNAHTQGQVIGVAVSENDGTSWAYTTSVVGASGIADRPWLAARDDGKVVLVFYGVPGAEQCAYSTDAGRTWLVRTITNGAPPNAGNVVLDAQGRVWYTEGSRVLRWDSPCQGGVKFAFLPPSGAQILTQLAVTDASDVFIAQPSSNNARMEIRGMHGINSHSTKVLAVSTPDLRSNTFGAIAAKPDGSEIAIAWYGSTTAGNPAGSFSGSWNVYVARVTDFWAAAPNVTVTKVTSEPNHVGGFCMAGISCTSGDRDLLDYMGVAYDAAGAVHVAYGHDGATRNAEVRYAKLA